MATRGTLPSRADAAKAAELVDPDQGLLSREIYVDRDVYDVELDRIFTRAWLYVGHESQLRENGDYLTTVMGEDPVIVCRDSQGQIRAFLNSCRHRGMRVCRASEGNTSFFRCPYHSWTYTTSGDLQGVPKFRQAYEGVLDKTEWGLVEVGKIEAVHGFLFATWDAEARPLAEYMGDFMPFFDLTFGRDPEGIELIGGAHRWTVDTNWKHPVENFTCDMYHTISAHLRPAELGLMNPLSDDGYELNAGMGYFGNQFTAPVSTDFDGDTTLHGYFALPGPLTYEIKHQRQEMAKKYGDNLARLIPTGHGTIFPHFSWLDLETQRCVRVVNPIGPGKSMIYQWCVVDKSLPQEVKDSARTLYELTFGPAGILEVDDGENWRECQEGMSGYVGRQQPTNMFLGLGRERTGPELAGEGTPGSGGEVWSEVNQRQFIRHWRTYMDTDSTPELNQRLDAVNN